MITTKHELHFYISEDAKANGMNVSLYEYWKRLFLGHTRAYSFRFLRCLRKYEYYLNKGSILKFYYRYRYRKIGLKYGLSIPPNICGYGLSIPHFEGGG